MHTQQHTPNERIVTHTQQHTPNERFVMHARQHTPHERFVMHIRQHTPHERFVMHIRQCTPTNHARVYHRAHCAAQVITRGSTHRPIGGLTRGWATTTPTKTTSLTRAVVGGASLASTFVTAQRHSRTTRRTQRGCAWCIHAFIVCILFTFNNLAHAFGFTSFNSFVVCIRFTPNHSV
jgi:hypothetical protein